MLMFNCTQAACEFFSSKSNGKRISRVQAAPSSDWRADAGAGNRLLSQWQLHSVKLKRKSVLLAMHMETRFAMVFVDIKQNDLADFVQSFIERWLNEMMRMGMELDLLNEADLPPIFECFLQEHREFELLQRSDRSVQSHINQTLHNFQNLVADVGALPATPLEATSFDEWVNGLLRTIGGKAPYFVPDEAMFQHWWSQFGPTQRATPEHITEACKRRQQAQWNSPIVEGSYE